MSRQYSKASTSSLSFDSIYCPANHSASSVSVGAHSNPHSASSKSGKPHSQSSGNSRRAQNNTSNNSKNNNTYTLNHPSINQGRPRKQEQRHYKATAASASYDTSVSPEMELPKELLIDKKGKVNLNHLLNFQFPPRQSAPNGSTTSSNGLRRRRPTYNGPYNKEKFINANYRFVMMDGHDYSVNLADPDTLVEWDNIVQVIMCSSKPPSCPICLFPPSAARVTKCGHVYCWHCILQYLHLSDKQWRKCPICYDSIYARDLKSVRFTPINDIGHPTLQRPSSLKMYLMERQSGSSIALPKVGYSTWNSEGVMPPEVTNAYAFPFSKLLLASPEYMLSQIHDKDIEELKQALSEAREEEYHVKSGTPPQQTNYVPGFNQYSPTESSPMSDRPFIEKALSLAHEQRKAIMSNHTLLKGISPSANCNIPQVSKSSMCSKDFSAAQTSPRSDYVTEQVPDSIAVNNTAARLKTSGSPKLLNVPVDHNTYYFYQSSDGQHLYMHPLDIKILKHEFGDYALFPEKIEIDVIHVSESTLDEDLRKRCKYLGHLPLSCDVGFCEVDLRGIVSEATLKLFERELNQRLEKRLLKERKEDSEKKKSESRHAHHSQGELLGTGESSTVNPGGLSGHSDAREADWAHFEDQFPSPASPFGSIPIGNGNIPSDKQESGINWNTSSAIGRSIPLIQNSFAKVAAGSPLQEEWPTLGVPTLTENNAKSPQNMQLSAAQRTCWPSEQNCDAEDVEDDYYVDDDLGWTLDLEEAVLTKDGSSPGSHPIQLSNQIASMQSPMNLNGLASKKKGKKNQVVVMSNSSSRRRL